MKVYNPNAIGVTTGFGMPTGGTSGQLLQKVNATNYNTEWRNTNTPEYLQVGKSIQQTFVLGSQNMTGWDTPFINTLSSSSWNSTTGVFTAGKDATYRVWGSFIVNVAADNPGDYYSLSVLQNGSKAVEQIQTVYASNSCFKPSILLPAFIKCVAGDTLRFSWYQTMNANRVTTNTGVQNYIVIEEMATKLL